MEAAIGLEGFPEGSLFVEMVYMAYLLMKCLNIVYDEGLWKLHVIWKVNSGRVLASGNSPLDWLLTNI